MKSTIDVADCCGQQQFKQAGMILDEEQNKNKHINLFVDYGKQKKDDQVYSDDSKYTSRVQDPDLDMEQDLHQDKKQDIDQDKEHDLDQDKEQNLDKDNEQDLGQDKEQNLDQDKEQEQDKKEGQCIMCDVERKVR